MFLFFKWSSQLRQMFWHTVNTLSFFFFFPAHRMASFGWKRKVGEKVSKSVVQQFEAEEEKAGDDDGPSQNKDVDWMHAIKRRREVLQGDCVQNSKRLKDEGALLAEEGR